MSSAEARALIDGIFEEEALVVGGLASVHRLEDEVVWGLVRSLDAIREKARRRLEGMGLDVPAPDGPGDRPHPAVEDFLLKLRRS